MSVLARLEKFGDAPLARVGDRADFAATAEPIEAEAPAAPAPHEVFAQACARLQRDTREIESEMRAELVATLEAILRAVAPDLMKSDAAFRILDVVSALQKAAKAQPVEIRARPDLIALLDGKTPDFVTLLADEAAGEGAFRAAWPQGGMERDAGPLVDDILAALDQARGQATGGSVDE
jgi:hypothetical protein